MCLHKDLYFFVMLLFKQCCHLVVKPETTPVCIPGTDHYHIKYLKNRPHLRLSKIFALKKNKIFQSRTNLVEIKKHL